MLIAPPRHTSRLPLLDGLRGSAAIMVMLYHVHNKFGWGTAFSRGYIFVDFFFLLSGFVLTLAAEPKMSDAGGAWRFLLGRIARLWPMIIVGAVTGAMIQGSMGMHLNTWAPLLIMALFMIPTQHPISHDNWEIFPLNGPQWSLMFEWHANIMHALFLHRMGKNALLCLLFFLGLALFLIDFSYQAIKFGPDYNNCYLAIPRIMWGYTLGILLARIWRQKARQPRVQWWVAFLLPVAMVIALPHLPLSVAIGDALAVLCFLPMLFWLAALAQPPHAVTYYLTLLGKISFPLYAVHLPIVIYCASIGSSQVLALTAISASLAAAQMLAMLTSAVNGWRDGKRISASPSHAFS